MLYQCVCVCVCVAVLVVLVRGSVWRGWGVDGLNGGAREIDNIGRVPTWCAPEGGRVGGLTRTCFPFF